MKAILHEIVVLCSARFLWEGELMQKLGASTKFSEKLYFFPDLIQTGVPFLLF